MIHITQGHEKGIGLEVFFKALLYLPQKSLKNFKLYADLSAINETLTSMGVQYSINQNSITLLSKTILIHAGQGEGVPSSTMALIDALKSIRKGDVLVTLPTSKDQLIFQGKRKAGYTEFFRSYYEDQNISMVFGGPEGFMALLTDHIPLKEVTHKMTEELIENKTTSILNGLNQYFYMPETLVFAGINPHAGEGGLLGTEEQVFVSAIKGISKKFRELEIVGPLPGDTLHFESSNRKNKLFIYSYHDQGLPSFKARNGLFGINISLGMPFLRLSVDHGTAFHLYGKNSADCRGCLYTLEQALRVNHDN